MHRRRSVSMVNGGHGCGHIRKSGDGSPPARPRDSRGRGLRDEVSRS